MSAKKIVFITGTRADFGKLKTLMLKLQGNPKHDIQVFVTGMHTLSKFGSTWDEVRKAGIKNIYRFINQNENDSMDQILAKTVSGFSDFIKETRPEMIVIHGDRVEALAGAIVGSLNNILVAHIEGGEVSGTIDELIRHSVSKLSHIHFVSNEISKNRLLQLGEQEKTIFVIGSPDIDVMNSHDLPSIDAVKTYYNIPFDQYSILLFHPVTTEYPDVRRQGATIIETLIETMENFVVLYPNNDHGTELILSEYQKLLGRNNFCIFPSMRFEYFLTLMRNARYMIGNSSAGVREAPHFGVPAINLGSRQNNRAHGPTIIDAEITHDSILNGIDKAKSLPRLPQKLFGQGNSTSEFCKIIDLGDIFSYSTQKHFVDRP